MRNMTKTSFGDQLQQIWHTRPVRLPRQGPIAGVAAGFGQRYDVDPVLVRVAFVVSTIFGGAGIVLYLLAWLLLSESGYQASAAESLLGKGQSSQSQTKTIVLIVALAIAVSTMGPVGVGLGGSGLISLALMLAGWWMLHMRTPEPPPGTTTVFGEFTPDGGITATGYPGAVFPQGSPRTVGAMYTPPTSVYTPYTKLPDSYIPEAPVPGAQPAYGDAETSLLDKRDTEDASGMHEDARSDAEPALSDKSAVHTTSIAAETERLSPTTASSPTTGSLSLGKESGDSPAASNKPTPVRSANRSAAVAGSAFTGSPTPPSWDPLGVAPLAWDLPEPPPAHALVAPAPKRPRSRLTPVVIGLAILAAAGAGAAAASGVEWMTPGRIGAAALAVIGLGLVLGAFLRRGYGLLVLTAPLAGFVLLASAIGPVEFDRGTMGEHTWAPTSVTDLSSDYKVTMGSGTLDLRALNLTENRTVDVDVQMGDVHVLVPSTMTVRTNCTATMGEARCVNGISGPNTPGAPVLDLNVDVRAGSAEVQRG
ncbi:PspC domain-containing protein [Nocardia sp. NPDC023852]|uniref:PspC domain-containing protein n=1 Tax=Nocardia sp. NPDC023852 TaxID=3154697 RepID=UPI003411E28E